MQNLAWKWETWERLNFIFVFFSSSSFFSLFWLLCSVFMDFDSHWEILWQAIRMQMIFWWWAASKWTQFDTAIVVVWSIESIDCFFYSIFYNRISLSLFITKNMYINVILMICSLLFFFYLCMWRVLCVTQHVSDGKYGKWVKFLWIFVVYG